MNAASLPGRYKGHITRVRKFLRAGGKEQSRLLEAAFWLGLFQFALPIVPFKFMARGLGMHKVETDEVPLSAAASRDARAVAHAVQTMACNLPWHSRCLVQAAAAKRMLDRRCIPSTLYVGVARDEKQKLIAHAWLRCGDVIITGKAEKDCFTTVSMFT
jgi:hypothetical protein